MPTTRYQQIAPRLAAYVTSVVLFVPLLVLPMIGFGRYVSELFPFFCLIVAFGSLALARRPLRWPGITATFTLLITASLVGWFIGYQTRLFFCRGIQNRLAPVIEALDRSKVTRGVYPAALSEVPEARSLGHSIREGKFIKVGIELSNIDTAEATFYLSPDRYACVIPIEKPLPISITGFHVYRYLSASPHWEKDYIVWFITPL